MNADEAREAQLYAGVPARYLGQTMSCLVDHAEATFGQAGRRAFVKRVDEVQAWMDDETQWCLVLHGPAGTGKTAVAAALVAEAGIGARPGFLTAGSYVDRLRDTPSWGLTNVRFLVLDDLGSEYATYFSNSCIDALVAEMYQAQKARLVLTTNMSTDHIAEAYSERMRDRLHEGATWVDFKGIGSFRRGA